MVETWNHLKVSFTCPLGQMFGWEDSKTEAPPHGIPMWFGFLTTWQSQSSQSFCMAAQSSKSKNPNEAEAKSPFVTQLRNPHSVGLRITTHLFSRAGPGDIFSMGGNVEVFCNHVSQTPQWCFTTTLTKSYYLIFGYVTLQKCLREIQAKKL